MTDNDIGGKVSSLVTIYGCATNEFCWRDIIDKNIYQTTGLIFSISGKEYIITTRNRLISCKNIIVYYSCCDTAKRISYQNCKILYHCPWLNLCILGTENKTCFDPTSYKATVMCVDETLSDISAEKTLFDTSTSAEKTLFDTSAEKTLFDTSTSAEKTLSDTSTSSEKTLFDEYVDMSQIVGELLNKKSKYYMVSTDTRNVIESNIPKIYFDCHTYQINFLKTVIYDKSYVDDICVYKFKNPDGPNSDVVGGIHGSIVISASNKLIGIICNIDKTNVYCVPIQIIKTMVDNVICQLDNGTNLDNGKNFGHNFPLIIPFEYVVKNTGAIVADDCTLKVPGGQNFELRKNDRIISIDNREIIIKNQQALIIDESIDKTMPISLEIYLKINLKMNIPTDIKISRGKKKCLLGGNVLGEYIGSIYEKYLPLTNQPAFFPNNIIPFVNIKNIVMVQLTKELIDIMARHNIEICNDILDKFFDGHQMNRQIIIIIDCLDIILANKHNLPCINFIKRQKINCPIVTKINNIPIDSFQKLGDIVINVINEQVIVLKLGLSLNKQTILTIAD